MPKNVQSRKNPHRLSNKQIAGAALIMVGAGISHKLTLWRQFFTDPVAFDAKYPAA